MSGEAPDGHAEGSLVLALDDPGAVPASAAATATGGADDDGNASSA
jgi:hypothetical protein